MIADDASIPEATLGSDVIWHYVHCKHDGQWSAACFVSYNI